MTQVKAHMRNGKPVKAYNRSGTNMNARLLLKGVRGKKTIGTYRKALSEADLQSTMRKLRAKAGSAGVGARRDFDGTGRLPAPHKRDAWAKLERNSKFGKSHYSDGTRKK